MKEMLSKENLNYQKYRRPEEPQAWSQWSQRRRYRYPQLFRHGQLHHWGWGLEGLSNILGLTLFLPRLLNPTITAQALCFLYCLDYSTIIYSREKMRPGTETFWSLLFIDVSCDVLHKGIRPEEDPLNETNE